MKTTINFFAACLIVLLAACSKKQEVTTPSIQKSISLNESTAFPDPCANPLNPYDSIGRLHNIVLDSLRHYVKVTRDTTRAGKAKYLSSYFLSHYGKRMTSFNSPDEKRICLDYKSVLLTQKVSKTAQGFFVELSTALDGITDLDHYDDYKRQIERTESSILAAKLPTAEQTNLLITASVLRHSGHYWMETYRNGDVQPLYGLDGLIRKILGVITGIAADATVVAYSYFLDPINIAGNTAWMSEICGYYTGWY